ncbi:hypothetical protein ACQUWM_09320 [Marinobacter sp. DUT-3]|uniref:hypothetical protein n=1 Tax=Marinobacter sp. DUT-3 TaxID=3412036 RepID=UPI003D17F8C9
MADSSASDYYEPFAYRSDAIPAQSNQTAELNRTGLDRSASFRMPWGNTRDVIPPIVFSRISPKILRRVEKHGDLFDGIGFQGRADHECLRHAKLAFRSRVIDALDVFGKGFFLISVPIVLVSGISFELLVDKNESWPTLFWNFCQYFLVFSGLPALMWLSSAILFKLFPKWCLKTGRGPEWGVSRCTGLVSVWQYPRKRLFRKREEPTVTQYPFYEFDGRPVRYWRDMYDKTFREKWMRCTARSNA